MKPRGRSARARARAAAYETRLRAALSELAATDSCIEAFRGAVRLVETFAATNALVDGFDPSFDKGDNSFDKGGVGAYAGVLVPGAEARSRALRVVHASARSRRGVGDEMRAWEGDAWPSVGEARLAGPLDRARSNSARSNSKTLPSRRASSTATTSSSRPCSRRAREVVGPRRGSRARRRRLYVFLERLSRDLFERRRRFFERRRRFFERSGSRRLRDPPGVPRAGARRRGGQNVSPETRAATPRRRPSGGARRGRGARAVREGASRGPRRAAARGA